MLLRSHYSNNIFPLLLYIALCAGKIFYLFSPVMVCSLVGLISGFIATASARQPLRDPSARAKICIIALLQIFQPRRLFTLLYGHSAFSRLSVQKYLYTDRHAGIIGESCNLGHALSLHSFLLTPSSRHDDLALRDWVITRWKTIRFISKQSRLYSFSSIDMKKRSQWRSRRVTKLQKIAVFIKRLIDRFAYIIFTASQVINLINRIMQRYVYLMN